ncbi:MAG TPA: D-alanine--D-alanine ligase family protein [Spirochaetia bacterium]|nr:D-alanine--D-alanine ligase family protein [Spirochaetales bacterium]HRS65758.1 D-alanine--D-alanine ligase family protein [Spirochaetia bacterium]HOT59584.1 D-alanine--D-alanine ligase family protein [Spirochaetales bacterium]HPD80150.1 D-alanine--D-alanine ligase family protein [Spirochaetales bacterium]HQG40275.1 D-alanine--D-alanine ligase family protein [Spirochaetales bacterium]
MKIAILYGGKSAEHDVSRISAFYVAHELLKKHKLYLIGITTEGLWYLQPDSVNQSLLENDPPLELRTDAPRVLVEPGKGLIAISNNNGVIPLSVDVVFPVLHGTFGEDGTIQGLLACADIPYVGCDVYGSAIGMDKTYAKKIWMHSGLPVVPFLEIHTYELSQETIKTLTATIEDSFQFPVIVKPARAGSSVGIQKATNSHELSQALMFAGKFDTKLLVEPFLPVREIECSVVGNTVLKSFPPGEIKATHEFYDYEAKYIDPHGADLLIPAPLADEQASYIQDLALQAYKAAGLKGLARVDFFIDTKTGKIMLNEVNTMPGFTSISMFPKMCEYGGLSYENLLDSLLKLALENHEQQNSMHYTRT